MKAATYPEADHIAATNPIDERHPGGAAVRLDVLNRVGEDLLGGSGRDRAEVVDQRLRHRVPEQPSRETITTSMGKIASTP